MLDLTQQAGTSQARNYSKPLVRKRQQSGIQLFLIIEMKVFQAGAAASWMASVAALPVLAPCRV